MKGKNKTSGTNLYVKSLEDEIDWKIIDQLHNATITFSTKSIEIKKCFFSFIGILIPILIKFNDTLNLKLCNIVYIAILSFWIIDSYTYHYQQKLRRNMDKRFENISKRNQCQISNFTTTSTACKSCIMKSIFNESHSIYMLAITINTLIYLYIKIK